MYVFHNSWLNFVHIVRYNPFKPEQGSFARMNKTPLNRNLHLTLRSNLSLSCGFKFGLRQKFMFLSFVDDRNKEKI